MGKADGKTNGKAAATEYVVLERNTIPATDSVAEFDAWVPVATVAASGKQQAIRLHTGEGENVIAGTWKAVPLSSWKGGETTRTKITSERLPLEEAVG